MFYILRRGRLVIFDRISHTPFETDRAERERERERERETRERERERES